MNKSLYTNKTTLFLSLASHSMLKANISNDFRNDSLSMNEMVNIYSAINILSSQEIISGLEDAISTLFRYRGNEITKELSAFFTDIALSELALFSKYTQESDTSISTKVFIAVYVSKGIEAETLNNHSTLDNIESIISKSLGSQVSIPRDKEHRTKIRNYNDSLGLVIYSPKGLNANAEHLPETNQSLFNEGLYLIPLHMETQLLKPMVVKVSESFPVLNKTLPEGVECTYFGSSYAFARDLLFDSCSDLLSSLEGDITGKFIPNVGFELNDERHETININVPKALTYDVVFKITSLVQEKGHKFNFPFLTQLYELSTMDIESSAVLH